jgi:hypothetical protein
MTISDRNTETVLEALAERIRALKTDIFLKDMEIERLKGIVADLEGKEAQNGNAN